MKNKSIKSLITILTLISFTYNSCIAQKNEISASQISEWVTFLSADNMMGRRNGSPEMKTAADWIAGKYSEFGLKPIAQIGGFIQNYTFISRQNKVNENNVIGLIEGSDPELKDEYIVLSAHFDHIGVRRGSKPDSIYNGADDNAAGTAALVGIAKAINDSGIKPGRSIIFAAFSGEESGMRGSRYFVANSPVPLKNIYANLNFEMIGHSELLGKNKYYMTGCQISDLDNIISLYNKRSIYVLVDTIKLANKLFSSSDNIAFSRISTVDGITKGIPSGTFATTTMAPHIHSVTDEVKLFDLDNMAGLVNYFSKLVLWLSDNKTEIKFTDPSYKKID